MTTTPTPPAPARPHPASTFARIALRSFAAATVLAVVGCWPTAAQAGSPGVIAMLAAIGLALVAGWIGLLPTIVYLRRPPRDHPSGILGGLALRFALTVGLAVAAWGTGAFPKTPLLLWVGIAQLVILAVDVPALAGLLRKAAEEAS